MDIAALNVEVTFQKNMVVTDEVGNHKKHMGRLLHLPRHGRNRNGTESSGAATVNPEESMDFTARWCSELAAVEPTKYRIITQGKIYDIVYVNPMATKEIA